MKELDLPAAVIEYLEASNRHDIESYVRSFSDNAQIEEVSLGHTLVGKEIENYFVTYFVRTNTHTDIIEYTINEEVVNMRVWFKGDFAGNEVVGLYTFFLNNGRIEKLKCDLAY
ncbi:hypothetical protein M3194_12350 [Paenibacillus glycanilyticus]|uniref:hypothetical protein n=1 Tax=Paenibacillus glycanilyticus TaxID=126569 RepID=UPI00203C0344|nr:hypothetical protein [Paenibacillus glycanilyticus]MCM3628155.1 hypothetical protein [Paenibacillus glycanilyticus]